MSMGNRKGVVLSGVPKHESDDEDFLRAVLAFANGARLTVRGGLLIGDTNKAQSAKGRDLKYGPPVTISSSERPFVRDLLGRMLEDRPNAPKALWESGGRSLLSDAKLSGCLMVDDKVGLTVGTFKLFFTERALLIYGIAQLTNAALPISRMVARCKYCKTFYVAERSAKGGPPPLVYCSPEHRKAHHDSSDRRMGKSA